MPKENKYNSSNWSEIDVNKINNAVENLAKELDMSHASTGNLDLYTLLQKYIKDENIRKKINEII